MIDRRAFMKTAGVITASGCLPAARLTADDNEKKKEPSVFEISLAQWSLHRTLFAGELTNLEFPAFARDRFGILAVEYVNTFFKEKARDTAYLKELKQRVSDAGSRSLLIMCDGEGAIGDADPARRTQTVENHHKWVEAAKALGCHSIRVNAASTGSYEEQQKLAADGLGRLTRFADGHGLNVLVENHGGLSSNGQWLAGVMKLVDHPRCGTLPDFGNFCFDWSRRDDPDAWYDRYRGVAELMPFAKAVSAKSNDFDEQGNERHTDYRRMLKIVLDAGYRGFIGVEYEGENLSEIDGVLATRKLLERIREELPTGAAAAG